ncbi:HNH endonuclease signature motif containing protein [Microbacterium sp. 18062]|uniref:HNH endonuclease signature motif containing protein n=1 Tax=Microbacterium sp. 18062 TaxID=2681410 RepID=UPI001359ACC4|nr:HNH endonuclease signature motif containing protein [Microbacterium sp. 18062]
MSSKRIAGFTEAQSAAVAAALDDLAAAEGAIAAAQVARVRAMARLDDVAAQVAAGHPAAARERDMSSRAIAAEVGCALRISDRTAQRQMSEAAVLVTDYAATLQAWGDARINRSHVLAIVDAGTPLPSEARGEFEAAALAICAKETSGRARRGLEMLAERVHPRTLTERHHAARETRAVRIMPLGDGMSDVIATLPNVLADGIYDRLTQQAQALKDVRSGAVQELVDDQERVDETGTGASATSADVERAAARAAIASDRRTMDQLRADVFADILLTGAPEADPTVTGDGPGTLGVIRATVQVTVSALTLLGHDAEPADLAGRSPIDADTARRLAGSSCTGWDRILTHPVTDAVLAVDRYRPSEDLKRHLRARDQHCRFPGCRMSSVRCDLDHTVDAAHGGATASSNLACLCRRHHVLKHATTWSVRQLADGVLEWTSPLGHVYLDDPPCPVVRFLPDHEPPPF